MNTTRSLWTPLGMPGSIGTHTTQLDWTSVHLLVCPRYAGGMRGPG